ncbi:hypothetical protein D3C71_2117040 [compost metagenome]
MSPQCINQWGIIQGAISSSPVISQGKSVEPLSVHFTPQPSTADLLNLIHLCKL